MNGKNGQGTHSTKMGADKSAENTPNEPKMFDPIWDFRKKAFSGSPSSLAHTIAHFVPLQLKRRDKKIKR